MAIGAGRGALVAVGAAVMVRLGAGEMGGCVVEDFKVGKGGVGAVLLCLRNQWGSRLARS